MTPRQRRVKRTFDLLVGVPLLLIAAPIILLLAYLARRDTGAPGIFKQTRVGKDGAPFTVLKLRTMRADTGHPPTTVTTSVDPRITPFGAWLRRKKLDELPQLINVVLGDMSLVGPRPDVPGWYDRLTGDDRVLLEVRPGLTSPAAIHFHDEECILAQQDDPIAYNLDILWPGKVALNRDWLEHWRLRDDIRCLARTAKFAVLGREL